MLRSKLVEIKEREHLEKISDIKGVQQKIEWGSQIRSYVFMPYTLAKDTRTGFENANINAVMDGDIDGFINAYLSALATGVWGRQQGPGGPGPPGTKGTDRGWGKRGGHRRGAAGRGFAPWLLGGPTPEHGGRGGEEKRVGARFASRNRNRPEDPVGYPDCRSPFEAVAVLWSAPDHEIKGKWGAKRVETWCSPFCPAAGVDRSLAVRRWRIPAQSVLKKVPPGNPA